MAPYVLTSFADGVASLTFNRPAQRNAMSVEMMDELRLALEDAAANPRVRCAVMQGAGGSFVAGADITSWSRLVDLPPSERGDEFRQQLNAVFPLVELLLSFPKPLVAAVRGHAAGAGLSLVLASDFVVAEDVAQFHFANIRAALTPDMAVTHMLPRIVGEARAMRLCLLGSQLDAREAEAIGLVSHVVTAGEFDGFVANLAAKIVAGPAVAMARTKRLIRASWQASLTEQFEAERDALADCAAEPDFVEAVAGFAERRAPRFGRSS